MRILILLGLLFIASGASAAVDLRLYGVNVDWDPNGNLWHLTDKVCNMSAVDSGTVLYEFQLYQGDIKGGTPIKIGAMRSAKPIAAHKCRSHTAAAIKVYMRKVPPGEYKIALFIGEYDGANYIGDVKYVLNDTFIKKR